MEIFEKIQKAIEQKDFSKAKEMAEKIDDETERYNTLGWCTTTKAEKKRLRPSLKKP